MVIFVDEITRFNWAERINLHVIPHLNPVTESVYFVLLNLIKINSIQCLVDVHNSSINKTFLLFPE